MKLLTLHGALAYNKQFDSWKNELDSAVEIISIDLPGHGNNTADLTLANCEKTIVHCIAENNLQDNEYGIFGYSFGGYCALHAALNGTIKPKKIITYGTKVFWDKSIVEAEEKKLNYEILAQKLPQFISHLNTIHSLNAKDVINNVKLFLQDISTQNYLFNHQTECAMPIIFMRGDMDNFVTQNEYATIKKHFINSRYLELKDQMHLWEKCNTNLIFQSIKKILYNDNF